MLRFQVLKERAYLIDYFSACWDTAAQKETWSVEALQKVCEQVNPT